MAKFIREDFEEWLNRQPEERAFNIMDNKTCLFASFLKETGQECTSMGIRVYHYGRNQIECPKWSMKVQDTLFGLNPVTFSVKEIKDIYAGLIFNDEEN